jgi:hypothetical protein
MKIQFKAEGPDGLDPIREAYETLCAIFDAAEVVEVDYGNGYTDVLLRLPGSGQIVDPNDANPKNGLEHFLLAKYDSEAGSEE